jgi:hypothetical protein
VSPEWLAATYVITDGDSVDVVSDKESALSTLNLGAGGIALVVPTYVGRASAEGHREMVAAILLQISQIQNAHPEMQVVLIVGMQWDGDLRSESIERLRALARLAARSQVPFVGLSLPKTRKTATLNAAIEVANGFRADGIGWLDDDVTLEPQCFQRMVERFAAKGFRGAVGAVKKGRPRSNLASRLLFLAKSVTQPACNYPHGCCILVERRVVAAGIPPRYVSDDGYVCFELLDPSRPNPLELLELVNDAGCLHYVGGSSGQNRARIRRMLTNHVIFMSDYPPAVSAYYFRHILFYGLWPLAPWDKVNPPHIAAAKWVLKSLYLCWFLGVATDLFVRGLIKRPRTDIPWGGVPDSDAPPLFNAADTMVVSTPEN